MRVAHHILSCHTRRTYQGHPRHGSHAGHWLQPLHEAEITIPDCIMQHVVEWLEEPGNPWRHLAGFEIYDEGEGQFATVEWTIEEAEHFLWMVDAPRIADFCHALHEAIEQWKRQPEPATHIKLDAWH